MSLVSTSIPNLLNGVSQQPSPLRQLTQGETQVNSLSSVIDGLIKRPPTEHLAELLDIPAEYASNPPAIHLINRNGESRHIVVVMANLSSARVDVYDLEGNSISTTGGNDEYLRCENPAEDLEFLTLADTTFILNKTKTVAMAATTTPGTLITSSKYQGFEDLPVETATHHVGDGNTSRFPVGFNFHDPNDLTVKVNGVTQSLGPNYQLEDDYKTINFTNKPHQHATIVLSLDPAIGDIYEVIGDEGNAFDSFYVKSVSKSAFEETVRPGISYQLDPSTLPHRLTPNPAVNPTSFTLSSPPWGEREAGDLESAKDPSFVGKTISNMFFYKNRLGFLSEDNVIFSSAGDYFRFFPKTVTSLLDDGPIDVAAAHTKATKLTHAIPFNESLTLFTDKSQFTIENAGTLTPKNISIVPSTEFENDPGVAPVGAGNYLFFASKKGIYSSVREYYIQADTVMTDALEITSHVPKYIPTDLTNFTTSSNDDVLIATSSVTPDKLYIYKWYTDGIKKLQSSWSVWELPQGSNIRGVHIVDNVVYLTVLRGTTLFLETIDLQYLNDTDLDFCVRVDRKVSLTGVYNSLTGLTTWTLPYAHSGDIYVVKSGAWSERKGANITNTRPSDTTIEAVGNLTEAPVIVGVPYDMTYEFSTQHIREKNGAQSVQSGRLQLRTMRINYEATGYFKIEVTPKARPSYEYEFTGVVLNQLGSTIGDVSLTDGTYRFPIQSKNDQVSIKLKSNSYLPCAFQNAEWEGFYSLRSRRI